MGRVLLGGFSNSIGRVVINQLPLYSFVFIRHLLITLLSLLLGNKNQNLTEDMKKIKKDKRLRVKVSISLLLSGIGTMLFYNALKLLPVSIVSVFENGVYTLFTVVLSIIFLKETMKRMGYLYLMFCMGGLFLIISKGEWSLGETSLIGILLLTVNAFLSAVNTTITASYLKVVSAYTNTTLKSFVSAFFALVMVLVYKENILQVFPLMTFALGIFILYSVVSGFLIKYLHSRSIQELNSSKTAIFTMMTPVISSILGMIIFQEWFNIHQYIGVLIVIASIYKLK